MRPKFAVGEEILLRSVNFPECNGEYTVLEVAASSVEGVGYKYLLDIDHHADGWGEHWAETSLRKKHQPGEMSFDNLMASLSSPKLLTHELQ